MYKQTESEYRRLEISKYLQEGVCPDCQGKRLKPEVLAVKISGLNIWQATEMSIEKFFKFINNLDLAKRDQEVADLVFKEIKSRLQFLIGVGLEYLTLSRLAGTLSGGEAQRIRLATQVGSELRGVLSVLDEPSVGLHQRDNGHLLEKLEN